MSEKEREVMQQRTHANGNAYDYTPSSRDPVTPVQPTPQSQPLQQPVMGQNGQNYNSIYPTVPGPVYNPAGPQDIRALKAIPPEKKSIVEAYLLWLFFGFLGAHHFYLRRYEFGILYFFTFGLLGAGWVIDMFRMPCLVSETNKRISGPIAGKQKKTVSDAYTCWFPLGLLGFHHFYLGNMLMGLLYLFTFGLLGIGWLIDLFRIPSLVKEANLRDPTVEKERSMGAAMALGISPFGLLGLHHFYLKRPVWGLTYSLTFGLLGCGYLADWFRIPILTKRTNNEIKQGPDYIHHLDDAYVLWFPFGLLGFHHFYLQRPLWGFLYFCTFGLLGVGWLVDGFRMHCLVKDSNRRTKERRQHLPVYQVPYAGVVVTTPNQPEACAPSHPTSPPSYDNHMYGAQGYPGQVSSAGCQYPQQTGYQSQQGPARVPSYMEQPPPYSPADGAQQFTSGSEKGGHI